MKKSIGILFLAVILIFSAGCISSPDVEEPEVIDPTPDIPEIVVPDFSHDPILGTWQTIRPVDDGKDTFDYRLVFTADRMGNATYFYSGGDRFDYGMIWDKLSENRYDVELVRLLTFDNDGKTMVTSNGYVYDLISGERLGGTWIERTVEGITYTQVFYADGTGLEIRYVEGEGLNYEHHTLWKPLGDNQIILWYAEPYTIEGNTMTYLDKIYTPVAGSWLNETFFYRDVITISGDLAVRSLYEFETQKTTVTKFRTVDGMLRSYSGDKGVILDDGTLRFEGDGDILVKKD